MRIKMKMKKIVKQFLLMCTLVSATGALIYAPLTYAEVQTPHQIVQQTTEQVLAIVKDAKSYYAKDPKRFNSEVMGVMNKVIDFDNFARGVMGPYASNQRYKTLTTEVEKAAFRERIEHFSAVFKQGLVDAYANGLLNFQGEKIETLPPRKGDDLTTGTISVVQKIFNQSSKPYVVQYTMHRNKEGEWKGEERKA